MVNISIKKESEDKKRSFVYHVASILVKDKTQATYNAMIGDIKELFSEKFERELVIAHANCDQVSETRDLQMANLGPQIGHF